MELTKEHFEKTLNQALGKLVTKDDFNHALSKLVTKEGLENTLSKFVTKGYLKQTIKDLLEELKAELASKSEITTLRVDIIELKQLVEKVNKRDLEDSNAFKSLVLGHGRRIAKLEESIGLRVGGEPLADLEV